MQALDGGHIQPRTNILPETKVNLRTTEVLLTNTAQMPMVRFPHRQHTAWLDCSNCHGNGLFEDKRARSASASSCAGAGRRSAPRARR